MIFAFVRRTLARRRSRLRAEEALYAVIWWPTIDAPVPHVRGPYVSRDTGFAVRNSIRENQRREEKMAHLVPFD